MSKPHNVYRDGKVHVLSERCETCIFRAGNLMHLKPGRVKDMVDQCLENESAIPCHKTLDGDNAICRGYYDGYADRTMTLRLAKFFEIIEEVAL